MVHQDLDRLFLMLLDSACELLAKNGEMYPIAASLSPAGDITPIAAYWGDDHPDSNTVIGELSAALISQAFPAKTAALGLAYDVKFAADSSAPKRDGIKIDLEHANGECLSVVVPYSRSSPASRIDLVPPFRDDKAPKWFVAHHTNS